MWQNSRVSVFSTSVLNDLLNDAKLINPPPSRKGRVAKLYYMTEVSVKPPTFVLLPMMLL